MLASNACVECWRRMLASNAGVECLRRMIASNDCVECLRRMLASNACVERLRRMLASNACVECLRRMIASNACVECLLPPKMNRKSCQEPFSPIAPTDSVKTPFLCQLNMDEKTQDEKELLSWLIDLKLPQYFQNFHSEGYDMISVRGVTPEDLTTIGITKAGHRKKLLSEITKLGPSPRLPTHKPAEVGQWLTLLDLAAYESNFIEGGFDEMDFIKDLDLSDLEMIEIKKKGHQKKLLLAVQKLSDVELTAELDAVVAVSKSDSPVSKTQAPRKPAKRLDERAEPSSLQGITPPSLKPLKPIATANHTLTPPAEEIEESTREFSFPAPPPANELESAFLLNRDNLPPPSGKESSNPAGEPNVPTPPKAPVRAQTQKVNQSVNQEAPRPRLRTSSQPVAPKPKPKPRPAQNVGQVRTASEYHANEAPAVIKPTTPQKPNLKAASEDSESAVTASRSRDFWLQNQQQPQPPSQAAVTPTRTKSISGIKPLPAQRPNTMPDAESPAKTPPEPLTRKPSLKKVPPPTPPRRDSMSSKKPEAAHDSSQNGNESTLAERSRTFSGRSDCLNWSECLCSSDSISKERTLENIALQFLGTILFLNSPYNLKQGNTFEATSITRASFVTIQAARLLTV
eukprot:gene9119-16778_t